MVSIESEAARHGTDPSGRELVVEPSDVASLIAELRRAPIRNLVGIAWFRLPTTSDERAWSLQTWRAVMLGQPQRVAPPAVRFRTDVTGARDMYLLNEGSVDVKLPARVIIAGASCEFADAVPPYNLERQMTAIRFVLQGDDLLRPKEERLIGWIRCSSTKLEAHVSY